MASFIHPTALVEKGAELADDVHIGPYCIVGSHVKMGRATKVHSHAVITGHTTLGEENEVFPFSSIGHAPQDLKYKGEPTLLIIGSKNKIRENTTLQPGTVQGGGKTVIGDGNLLMAYTHVAHDCMLGHGNILANAAQLAGHVILDDGVIIGAAAGIHQFCRLGNFAMIGAGAMVTHDVTPYCVAQGDRAMLRGLNVIGMRRRGFSATQLKSVREAYKLFFRGGFATVAEAYDACLNANLFETPEVKAMGDFILASQRGVTRPPISGSGDDTNELESV